MAVANAQLFRQGTELRSEPRRCRNVDWNEKASPESRIG